MVVLAVHILRDAAADRGKAGAWHNGWQPAPGSEGRSDLADPGPGLDIENAGCRVEGKHPVEPGHVDHPPAIVQRRIAIAAAHADGGHQPVLQKHVEGAAALRPGEPQCRAARFVLDDLLPAERSVLRYDGSLTTAPFTEGVAWVVFTEPRAASAGQVAAHDRLVSSGIPGFAPRPNPPGNARPVQDLAGRRLFGDRMVGSLP